MTEGYYRAPADSEYTFSVLYDDVAGVYIENSDGDYQEMVVGGTNYNGACCKWAYGRKKVALKAGFFYRMKALLIEHEGGDYIHVNVQYTNSNGQRVDARMQARDFATAAEVESYKQELKDCSSSARPDNGIEAGVKYMYRVYQFASSHQGKNLLSVNGGTPVETDSFESCSPTATGFATAPNGVIEFKFIRQSAHVHLSWIAVAKVYDEDTNATVLVDAPPRCLKVVPVLSVDHSVGAKYKGQYFNFDIKTAAHIFAVWGGTCLPSCAPISVSLKCSLFRSMNGHKGRCQFVHDTAHNDQLHAILPFFLRHTTDNPQVHDY